MIPDQYYQSTTRNYCIEQGLRRTNIRPPKDNERILGNFTIPAFQRPVVWTLKQNRSFIESIWLHLPISLYVYNSDDQAELGYPCDRWLLDGQQRWTAIIGYVNNEFPVYDLLFGDLPLVKRRKFLNHPFPCQETHNLTPKECEDIYLRLAYGGTSH